MPEANRVWLAGRACEFVLADNTHARHETTMARRHDNGMHDKRRHGNGMDGESGRTKKQQREIKKVRKHGSKKTKKSQQKSQQKRKQ